MDTTEPIGIRAFVCQFGTQAEAEYWQQRAEATRQLARNTNSPELQAKLENQASGFTANAIAAAS